MLDCNVIWYICMHTIATQNCLRTSVNKLKMNCKRPIPRLLAYVSLLIVYAYIVFVLLWGASLWCKIYKWFYCIFRVIISRFTKRNSKKANWNIFVNKTNVHNVDECYFLYSDIYIEVLLEWVDFFSFQIYYLIVN